MFPLFSPCVPEEVGSCFSTSAALTVDCSVELSVPGDSIHMGEAVKAFYMAAVGLCNVCLNSEHVKILLCKVKH